MGCKARKTDFGVSDKATRFKPISSAKETSQNSEIWLEANLDMIDSDKGIAKALIRLRGCAGWSATLLFINPRRQVSRVEAHILFL